jgi:hypothetical protein
MTVSEIHRCPNPEWPIVGKIKFDGTGASCDAVTEFLGGCNASHTHRWKGNTLIGGWVIQKDGTEQEFWPGDYICEFSDGDFAVGHVCGRAQK